MNDLRTEFMERHHKRLYEVIDIVHPPAKRVCPEKAQEEPTGGGGGSPLVTMPQPDVAGPSTAAVTESDVVGPSNASTVEKEAYWMEAGPDVALVEGAPDEKDILILTAPPSWNEMLEMLKRVSCFTDVKASSTKMSDFCPLTKWISVNMGGDPSSFVSALLPFDTPESAVFCMQYLQE